MDAWFGIAVALGAPPRGTRLSGTLTGGDRLLRHGKGVGLSLLLRDLPNGYQPLTEEEISARSYQASD